MNTNHTQSPWTALRDTSGTWRVVTDSMHLHIAQLGNAEVDEHDARLIASAPELLAAKVAMQEEIEWLKAENQELRQRPTFQKVQDLLLKIAQQQKEIQRLQAGPMIVRTCRCNCGETFNWPVQFSEHTPKLSGESRRSCPKCSQDAFTASPWRVLVNGQLRHMDIGDKADPQTLS